MTPIFPRPTHEHQKQTSTVFHRDIHGKTVAKFFGPNHVENANQFCAVYEDDSKWKMMHEPASLAEVMSFLDHCSPNARHAIRAKLIAQEANNPTPYDEA